MPDYFFILVVILFTLAIADLVVGVSNDAVNFLNSAVGSKVAPRNVIMIVASLGIFLGATFSSGMMEIARKGIFNPNFFYFSEIIVIFLAVMLTDIILLDLFNTFGLPTSTTVSIVFELLGAAVIVALIKVSQNGEGIAAISQYINSSRALTIITGIFSSIVVAFSCGIAVQYISRLLFTFHYQRRLPYLGGIWAGLALTFITYFLLIKGIKGASFVPDAFIGWVSSHTLPLLLGTFVFWGILSQLLIVFFKVNILRFIVLFGTFSLAMAFAGNDLVNFIGVPLAGMESFKAWQASGINPAEYPMDALANPIRTNTIYLVLAGVIMTLTLWLSKKARSVTDTEVSLARQDEGAEFFSSNALARGIVGFSRMLSKGVQWLLPEAWHRKTQKSFEPVKAPRENGQKKDKPAFDLVRASVNLTVASILIAFATSLKLPLSTTYVSFMVGMGSSLADRAWGRDSAVFRIAGVLNVIGGWFVTALVAFTVSGLFAALIHFFGPWAVGGLLALVVFLISRTYLLHKQKELTKNNVRSFENRTDEISSRQLIRDTAKKMAEFLQFINDAYQNALNGLLMEDRDLIREAREDLHALDIQNKAIKQKLYRSIQRIQEKQTELSRLYLYLYDLQQDIYQSTTYVLEACSEHVENHFNPLSPVQSKKLVKAMELVSSFLMNTSQYFHDLQFKSTEPLLEEQRRIVQLLESLLDQQINGVKSADYSLRNSMLFFSIQLETMDLIEAVTRCIQLYNQVDQGTFPKMERMAHPTL
ncbi:MAG: inorganic phosphate transporter [Lewinellaceae bacterium]|nr:inorganic phosphate transporter [Lewinellaceae bacterium]